MSIQTSLMLSNVSNTETKVKTSVIVAKCFTKMPNDYHSCQLCGNDFKQALSAGYGNLMDHFEQQAQRHLHVVGARREGGALW